MKAKLEELESNARECLRKITDLKELEELRLKMTGKKGELTALLKGLGALSAEERPEAGRLVNETRESIEQMLNEAKNGLVAKGRELKMAMETIDVTLPGVLPELGNRHPLTIVLDDLKQIFIGMGYEIAEGPDIENDYYNFEALNIPENHPAKDEQDTFYLGGGFMLRTSTSPVQVRTLEKGRLPIRVIAPGRVFRSDQVDATHSPVFHQLEGLVVDENITMGDLKGTLDLFARELFGERTKVRFRPHYFPFTEPSAEMDATCFVCGGSGCRVCKNTGWIELLGCGMVHPRVLSMSGVDPARHSGFAFGMGLERIAMQRYGITDMRLLYENDVNFLTQF